MPSTMDDRLIEQAEKILRLQNAIHGALNLATNESHNKAAVMESTLRLALDRERDIRFRTNRRMQ